MDDVLDVGRCTRDALDQLRRPRHSAIRGLRHRDPAIFRFFHEMDQAHRIVIQKQTVGIERDQIVASREP
jgi:hypothetical protein